MKMHLRKLQKILLLSGALLGLPAVAAEVELKVHHFLPPPATAHAKFIKPWADKVMRLSVFSFKLPFFLTVVVV